MVALSTILVALPLLLILPGWLWFRRKCKQSVWLLALPFFGVALWSVLAAAGVGAQSLSNIVELFYIAVVAVVVAYVKFLVFDRVSVFQTRGTTIAFAVIALITVGFRLFMPLLPE
jgi:hypothetical protein